MHDYYTIWALQIKPCTNGSLHSARYITRQNERPNGQCGVSEFILKLFFIIISGSFGEHLAKFKEIMNRPQSSGLKYNIDKCKFAFSKVEYLGYIITREDIKPNQNKN